MLFVEFGELGAPLSAPVHPPRWEKPRKYQEFPTYLSSFHHQTDPATTEMLTMVRLYYDVGAGAANVFSSFVWFLCWSKGGNTILFCVNKKRHVLDESAHLAPQTLIFSSRIVIRWASIILSRAGSIGPSCERNLMMKIYRRGVKHIGQFAFRCVVRCIGCYPVASKHLERHLGVVKVSQTVQDNVRTRRCRCTSRDEPKIGCDHRFVLKRLKFEFLIWVC